MVNREILHVNDLENFKSWLIKDGWTIQPTKGFYGVVRAVKEGKKFPLIVYFRFTTTQGGKLLHYTVPDCSLEIIRAYLRDKKAGNNG